MQSILKFPVGRNFKIVLLCVLFLFLASTIVGGSLFYKYKFMQSSGSVQGLFSKPQPKSEYEKIIGDLGKLMDLPKDETAGIATINGAEKYKVQEFFTKAKDGDKVIVFEKARIAILYDPKTKKILNTARVNPATPSAKEALPNIEFSPVNANLEETESATSPANLTP